MPTYLWNRRWSVEGGNGGSRGGAGSGGGGAGVGGQVPSPHISQLPPILPRASSSRSGLSAIVRGGGESGGGDGVGGRLQRPLLSPLPPLSERRCFSRDGGGADERGHGAGAGAVGGLLVSVGPVAPCATGVPDTAAATSGKIEDTPGARRLLPALNRSRSGRPQVPSSRRTLGL